MTKTNINRRDFLKGAASVAAVSTLPLSTVELAFADPAKNFTFAYISDAHIQHISGNRFVYNWDRGLIRAVAETNLLEPTTSNFRRTGKCREFCKESGIYEK